MELLSTSSSGGFTPPWLQLKVLLLVGSPLAAELLCCCAVHLLCLL